MLLNVNSPGGEADGVNELSRMIYEARGRKPVVAYVGGLAASGAYWIASAADEIVAEESALFGSIGVVATFRDTRGRDARAGVATYEIVSSQSPYKRPDPATEEGREQIQTIVDSQAEIFINAIARNRGVDPVRVQSDFGRGNLVPASQAIATGMADRFGTYETTLAAVAARFQRTKGAIVMEQPTTTATAPPDTHLAERARIAAILNSPEAEGREQLARTTKTRGFERRGVAGTPDAPVSRSLVASPGPDLRRHADLPRCAG